MDLNAAGRDELVSTLPGIGPALAERIIAFREDHGPFSDPSELARVPGIGVRRAERLSSRLSVRPSPLAPEAVEAAAAEGARPEESSGLFVFDSAPTIATDPPKPMGEPREMDTPTNPEAEASHGAADHTSGSEGPHVATSFPAPSMDEARFFAGLPRPRRRARRAVTALMVVLGVVVGAGAALQAERKAATGVRDDVKSLRADETTTHTEVTRQATELARQATELAATRHDLTAAVEAQSASAAKAEARAERITHDVAELAERTRRVQARMDQKVYKLDEAVKLIDWATMGGVARTPEAEQSSVAAALARP